MKSYIFWDVTLCSPFKDDRRFGGTQPPSSVSQNKESAQRASSYSIGFLSYSLTLKMQAKFSSET
jgi:hypothetical protein